MQPDTSGRQDANTVVKQGGETHASSVVESRVRPNVVTTWKRENLAFAQANCSLQSTHMTDSVRLRRATMRYARPGTVNVWSGRQRANVPVQDKMGAAA